MPSRKRKRAELSPEPDDSMQVVSDHDALITNDLDKEQNVWEGVRDEHFEAIEQVPLTLHRQSALINELDQQAMALEAKLPSLVMNYIEQRRNRAQICILSGVEANENPSALTKDVTLNEERPRSLHPTILAPNAHPAHPQSVEPGAMSPRMKNGTSALPRTHAPLGALKSSTTTRQMLSHIAGLAEELLRASEEKVNVAQATYDSVDRHFRILQQAIKDQEASITLGARPGHLEPGNLTDLAVGRWVRPSRATLSPISGEDLVAGDHADDQEHGMDQDPQGEMGQMYIPPFRGPGKKGRGRPKGPRPKSDDVQTQGAPLTITLPAPAGVPVSDTLEETYCYCQQGSFGEMIACDNKKCPREWYHVGCVGLETPPEGMKTWYCPDCRPARRGAKRK